MKQTNHKNLSGRVPSKKYTKSSSGLPKKYEKNTEKYTEQSARKQKFSRYAKIRSGNQTHAGKYVPSKRSAPKFNRSKSDASEHRNTRNIRNTPNAPANAPKGKCREIQGLDAQERRRVLALLGLCLRGGYLAVGGDAVQDAVREKHTCLILLAGDAAEHIRRRVLALSGQSGCDVLILPDNRQELGAALGKQSVAAVAVTNSGLAGAIRKKCRLKYKM